MTDNKPWRHDTHNQQKRALLKIRELKQALSQQQQAQRAPIAVIGIGCRFPGSINSPESFWSTLAAGKDCIGDIPDHRWNHKQYFSEYPAKKGRIYVNQGGFIDGVDQFDAGFFNISEREAAAMDPQQRLLLEVSWEALENAGRDPAGLRGQRVGVYNGVCTQDYARFSLHSHNPDNIDIYSFTGTAPSIASGRISHVLDFQGPNITVDTACSSSLVALHLAVQSLRHGEVDLALAGGVNIILSPENYIYFCHVNALSPEARCKTFADDANGYVRSEGCGVVALKLLDQALADGDPVWGVIRGSAINQDGQSFDLTAPNGTAQRQLIEQALQNAGVGAGEVNYVEAHGTGTPLGDPIEIGALGAIYGAGRSADKPLWIGALKSTIGHTEAASGIAGFIKTLLCLTRGKIPANLHCTTKNTRIPWADFPAILPTELAEWPACGERRLAGISAFGFSGTNAHIIVEAAPECATVAPRWQLPPNRFQRKSLWLTSKPLIAAQGAELHPFLQRRLKSPAWTGVCYEADLSLARFGFLRSHPVWGKVVAPGAVYIEAAFAAARDIFASSQIVLKDCIYHEVFVLEEGLVATMQLTLTDLTDDSAAFHIYSQAGAQEGDWRLHAEGSIHRNLDGGDSPPLALQSVKSRCRHTFDEGHFYQTLDERGYYYGADHRGVREAWVGEGEALAQIAVPRSMVAEEAQMLGDYYFHPAILDSAFQLLLMLLPDVGKDEMYVTLGKQSTTFCAPCQSSLWVHTRRLPGSDERNTTVRGDVRVYDQDGNIVMETLGYIMKRTVKRGQSHLPPAEVGIYHTLRQPLNLPAKPLATTDDVALLGDPQTPQWQVVTDALQRQGVTVAPVNPDDPVQPSSRPLVYLWPSWSPEDDGSARLTQTLTQLTRIINALAQLSAEEQSPFVILVQANNPVVEALAGLLYSARDAYHHCALYLMAWSDTADLANLLPYLTQPRLLGDECHLVCEAGLIQVPRLSLLRDVRQVWHSKLTLRERGNLSSLEWAMRPSQSLGANDVDIRVEACGLNLRDVFDALGLHPRQLHEWGLECTGVVVNIGSQVTAFKPGDSVLAFGTGCLAHRIVVPVNRVVHLPELLDFAEGATIPIAFLTAYEGLVLAGNLRAGQRVLIHGAAGGVGMAAVQIAHAIGAEVYGSCSPDKTPVLQQMGVAHVLNSRDIGFARQIPPASIDLVFNSLSREFIDVSVPLIREGGCFIEIGLNGWPVEMMQAQRPDIRYHLINLMATWEQHPELVKARLEDILQHIQTRRYSPLPLTRFSQQQTEQAFRQMQQGKHIGKVVILPETGVAPARNGVQVITGGTGALGIKLAHWLLQQGFSKLALLSRHQSESLALEKWPEPADVRHYVADVADAVAVEGALQRVRTDLGEITGVFHVAGATCDAPMAELGETHFERSLQSKVQGVLHLHSATQQDPIQRFVMFSSLAAVIGSAGAANYAAANGFLNGFCTYRQSLGLPALSIAWGPWRAGGLFDNLDKRTQDYLQKRGITPVGDANYFAALEALLDCEGNYPVMAMDWSKWVAEAAPRDAFFHSVSNSPGRVLPRNSSLSPANNPGSARPASRLLQDLAGTRGASRNRVLQQHLWAQLVDILGMAPGTPVDTRTGFFDLGLDSLTSVELRNRLQNDLQCQLSSTITFDYPNLDALLAHLLELTAAQLQTIAAAPELPPVIPLIEHQECDPFIRLDSMSDDELYRALLQPTSMETDV
ncbi:SDR family NAD(P)-dependent oxidoreductase [Cellvibrio japonicus]|uniref:Oxidoreductase, zinc-binding dehydrogenase family n=1 Tax=Cellvibrio japonicus (strain Ueda107) TaxID=498211 RepID=B3PCU1_CELJU|nr:SDR family NAD(P)-dependent oxidoreductase [Cellvibrio japonicus]ACE83632.1 oxidoreductase, zinc-binding dehydrogenase family [Cellvibrio japonicus Ueda107]QEI13310.1 SDR family NAD(P)-dependent oxidoreductase [Cellvibrio japonicus]QEI16884.1 SDR family NAD(P)-dependent oxidoreductase [Cellvibrio japonicus]QEI20462.1 SDR family NAD(P)-dependent oxidoreductase [Cellvibrio japonicus]